MLANEKLFTAIYIPKTPFINGRLKLSKENKYHFKLIESKKMGDILYHFIYERGGKIIHSYYFVNDPKDKTDRYIFVENNELYKDFIAQFSGKSQDYGEEFMDVYLDVHHPEEVLAKLTHEYNSRFYEENEPTPLCHLYGQRYWHDEAYMIGNRIALVELREAIDIALKNGEKRIVSSSADGEGYELFIKCVEDDFDWEEIELPYHDRECYVPNEPTPRKIFKNYKL